MSCFVGPTAQNFKILTLKLFKLRYGANPRTGEAASWEYLACLLEKLF